MKNRLSCLGYGYRMDGDSLPQIGLFGKPAWAKRKVEQIRMGFEEVMGNG